MPSGFTKSQTPQNGTYDATWLFNALGSDASRLAKMLLSGAMAPGNALAGNYDQREIDPNTGAVSPVDPRMVTDASNMAGLVSTGSIGMAPAESLAMGIKAYHGSPHSFDKFSMDKIGTGEGAQAYGHGLYFAENEGVAKGYKDTLTNDVIAPAQRRLTQAGGDPDAAIAKANAEIERLKGLNLTPETGAATRDSKIATEQAAIQQLTDFKNTGQWKAGHTYAVDINAQPEHFLDWDKPLTKQSPSVQSKFKMALASTDWGRAAMSDVGATTTDDFLKAVSMQSAGDVYNGLQDHAGSSDISSSFREAGLPGIKYLDAGSRATGDGTRNYVVFDDKNVNIDKKYAKVGAVPEKDQQKVNAIIAQLST